MNRKDMGTQFKRILSHTSSGSGNACASDQTDFTNTRKLAKQVPDTERSFKTGNNYMLTPDHEPLLRQIPTNPIHTDSSMKNKNRRRIQVSPNRISNAHLLETPRFDSACGQLSGVDFRQDCPRGIMSVTDIEFTMGEDEIHHNQIFQPPGSPMDDSHTTSYASAKLANKYYPVERCTEICCDENTCLWHRCVLKLPQHVRWEDRIITIELERNKNETFGFSHKAKQYVGKDEIYILVSKVERTGKAARSGLAVGDLILSANTVPLQTRQKLSEINFKTLLKLRLQIQHPMEISQKAATYVEQLAASMEVGKDMIVKDHHVPLAQPLSPSTSPSDTGFALSPTKENIPLATLLKPENKSGSKKHHQLPQVRVFVCGNATNEFVRCLIGDYINVHLDARACCFHISVKRSKDGVVSIANSESFSYLVKDSSESCINVELVSVSDDSFFHNCCSWMFTQRSVFILTFDTKRLSLSSATEMSRLCSLAHTVRTGVPGMRTNIKVYGISPADDSIHPDEVRTLFYTSLGEPLPDPKVIPLTSGSSCGEMKNIRLDIFRILTNICAGQHVIYPTAIALDMLLSHRVLTTTRQELTKMLEEWQSDSQQVYPESLYQVMEDLSNTANLLVTGSVNSACTSESVKEFVVPGMLFDYLARLTQFTDRDRVSMRQQDIWMSLCTTGIVSRIEMQEILSVCVSDPEKLMSCMEDLHLIFPVKALSVDSGFGDMSSMLFPFFLEDVPFTTDSVENVEKCYTLEFTEDIPSSSFFSFLSELSQSDECLTFTMKAQYVAHMGLQGHEIYLYFLKTGKQIQIFKKRSGRPLAQGKNTIIQHIQQTAIRNIPGSVRVMLVTQITDDARPPNNLPSSSINFSQPIDTHNTQPKQLPSLPGVSPDVDVEGNILQGAAALPDVTQNMDVSISAELLLEMNNMNNAVAVEELAQEEQHAQEMVLRTRLGDLHHIHRELNDLCKELSANNEWENLAGELGLSHQEVCEYASMLQCNPNRPPGRTFLETYMKDRHPTLLDLMRALLQMRESNPRVFERGHNLWIAALRNNSQFYRNFGGQQ